MIIRDGALTGGITGSCQARENVEANRPRKDSDDSLEVNKKRKDEGTVKLDHTRGNFSTSTNEALPRSTV